MARRLISRIRNIAGKNPALLLLLTTNSIILTATALMGPIYALYVEDLGGGAAIAGATFAVFALSAGITSLIIGKLADSFANKPHLLLAFGYSLVGIGFASFILVDSYQLLVIPQILIGIGEATYFTLFNELYSQHLDIDKQGTEWGIWGALNYLTVALGSSIGGLIVAQYGFNVLFILMSTMSLSAAILVLLKSKKLF